MTRTAALLFLALTLSCGPNARADGPEWRQWRGPEGTGFAADSNPPVRWSLSNNLRWKVEIPGAGHSSPIVSGERVYVMTAVKTDEQIKAAETAQPPAERGRRGGRGRPGGFDIQSPTNVYQYRVLAIDRATGRVAWNTMVHAEVPHEGTHKTGSFASSSPVTDGKHVYAFFGSYGLYCLDLEGNVTWQRDLGEMQIRNAFGEGASPALSGDTLVVRWDHEGDSFVAAFDTANGEEKWRVNRNEPSTWSTPVIVEVNGRNQAILAASNATIAYDLQTGKEVWRCSGLSRNVIPTPVVGHGMVYLMSGFHGDRLQAIRLEAAKGDITNSNAVVWTHDRGTPYTPSPLLAGDRLYFLGSNSGLLSCFDAMTGEVHYAGQRLRQIRNVYASPVGAGGHVYICGREGDVEVIEDGPEFKEVAVNTLGEGINASPAIVGDEIYIRGDRHLYCFSESR